MARSVTIHGLDESVYELLKDRARAQGQSLNKTTTGLLHQALGVQAGKADHRSDFLDLFGTWTPEHRREFEQAAADLRPIDPRDWR
jgi:hypothetical protein